MRMSTLLAAAPALDAQALDQIAALPLGGRIKVDPWTDQVELSKAKPVALTSAREKMEFEITPFFPYLTRLSTGGTEKVALTTSSPSASRAKIACRGKLRTNEKADAFTRLRQRREDCARRRYALAIGHELRNRAAY